MMIRNMQVLLLVFTLLISTHLASCCLNDSHCPENHFCCIISHQCMKKPVKLGQHCSQNSDCDLIPLSICQAGMCMCGSGSDAVSGQCVQHPENNIERIALFAGIPIVALLVIFYTIYKMTRRQRRVKARIRSSHWMITNIPKLHLPDKKPSIITISSQVSRTEEQNKNYVI